MNWFHMSKKKFNWRLEHRPTRKTCRGSENHIYSTCNNANFAICCFNPENHHINPGMTRGPHSSVPKKFQFILYKVVHLLRWYYLTFIFVLHTLESYIFCWIKFSTFCFFSATSCVIKRASEARVWFKRIGIALWIVTSCESWQNVAFICREGSGILEHHSANPLALCHVCKHVVTSWNSYALPVCLSIILLLFS